MDTAEEYVGTLDVNNRSFWNGLKTAAKKRRK